MRLIDCLGRRVLVRTHSWEQTLYELAVLEASDSGCVKVRYRNGHEQWLDHGDVERVCIVDLLSEREPGVEKCD